MALKVRQVLRHFSACAERAGRLLSTQTGATSHERVYPEGGPRTASFGGSSGSHLPMEIVTQ